MPVFEDPAAVRDAAFLSRVAYSDELGGRSLEQALADRGWTLLGPAELNAGLDAGDFDDRGYFSSGDAQGFVARKGGVLALAFRGAEGAEEGSAALLDVGQEAYYDELLPLIGAAVALADGGADIERVLVTGHSLGGSTAERFLFNGGEGLDTPFQVITFGSPGLDLADGGELGSAPDNVLLVQHAGDAVAERDLPLLGDNVQYDAVVQIVLPTLPEGVVVQPDIPPLIVPQHAVEVYQATAEALATTRLHEQAPADARLVVGTREYANVDAPVNDGIDLRGSEGTNLVLGLAGDDRVLGGAGSDLIDGGLGADDLLGHGGDDVVLGGPGFDLIRGGAGDDRLVGDRGNDRLFGHDGDDRMFGGDGNDVLSGQDGDDRLHGGPGNDRLIGGPGRDLIAGGDGDDVVEGGPDADVLTGGAGRDTFVYRDAADGLDRITDFTPGQGGDVLRLIDVIEASDGDDLAGFLELAGDGSATLRVDADGPGGDAGFVDLALLQDVSGVGLADLLADGNLQVATTQVA
ncbi:MAG TPA: type I secretion C-terminal target domain-containing protein [Geminicoccaceae bacterium]|nr:type I secretion C-terminal target domain-containing protein [Geminicoccaceae bacterium]